VKPKEESIGGCFIKVSFEPNHIATYTLINSTANEEPVPDGQEWPWLGYSSMISLVSITLIKPDGNDTIIYYKYCHNGTAGVFEQEIDNRDKPIPTEPGMHFIAMYAEAEALAIATPYIPFGCLARAVVKIKDLRVSITYGCAAHPKELEHETQVRADGEIVKHRINYSIPYSGSWDRAEIYLYADLNYRWGDPEAQSAACYKVATIEPEEDGTLEGAAVAYTQNYVEDFWDRWLFMLQPDYPNVYFGPRVLSRGNVTLHIYDAYGNEAFTYWKIDGPGEVKFIFNETVSCPVYIRITTWQVKVTYIHLAIYDEYDPSVRVDLYSDEPGEWTIALPRQGAYVFELTVTTDDGETSTYRFKRAIYPVAAVSFVGSHVFRAQQIWWQAGYRGTGHPKAYGINKIEIIIWRIQPNLVGISSGLLWVYAIGVNTTWPANLTRESALKTLSWLNVPVTIMDEKERVLFEGTTPCGVPVDPGDYYVHVPEVHGVWRFVTWVLVSSSPWNNTALVHVPEYGWAVCAVYTNGFVLDIKTLVESLQLGGSMTFIIDPTVNSTVNIAVGGRTLPGGIAIPENITIPWVIRAGVTPSTWMLPEGEYWVITINTTLFNNSYTFDHWEGVDNNSTYDFYGLGAFVPFNNIPMAIVKLNSSRTVSSVYTLNEGAEPVLLIKSKIVDEREIRGVPVTIMGIRGVMDSPDDVYYEEAKTPCEVHGSMNYLINISESSQEDEGWAFSYWENVDLQNGTVALVNLTYGRLIWAVYNYTRVITEARDHTDEGQKAGVVEDQNHMARAEAFNATWPEFTIMTAQVSYINCQER